MRMKYLLGGGVAVGALALALAALAQVNVSNFMEQGGSRWVIGGSLDVVTGGDLDMESGSALKIAGTAITSTAAELNFNDITTLGTGAASKAVVLDAGDDYIWPATGVLTYGGGAVSSTGVELDEYALVVQIDTLCTASSAWVVAPHAGDITKVYSIIDAAIATADAIITPKIATVAVTGGAITVAFAGSAAGDVDSSTPTAANTVTAGQAIELATNGACVNAVKTEITLLIAR